MESELFDLGILKRDSTNDIVPTHEFLIWLYNTKGHTANEWADIYTKEQEEEWMKEDIRTAIATCTMQVIEGRTYGKLDEKYVKAVYPVIKDSHDRLLEKHYRKFASKVPA